MSILDRFFNTTDDDVGELARRHGEASRFLVWAAMDETKALLERIDKEARVAIDIRDSTSMVAAAARANTLREIEGWIRGDIKEAQRDLESTEARLRHG